jgi:hypothetical protein
MNQGSELQVPSLTQLPTTPRIGNTKVAEAVIFVCTLMNASLFRPDGKKLGFVKGLLKTQVKEDIEYLDGEIDNGNPYVKRASKDEVDTAESLFDPIGSLRKKVEKDVGAELYAKLREQLSAKLGISVENIDDAMTSKAPLDTGVSQVEGVMPKTSRIPEHLRARSGK